MIPMGAIRQFNPVKLFVGVLVSHTRLLPDIEQRLSALYGPIDHRSPVIPFDFTDYYEAEMGDLIDRAFFSFERLIEADQLPEIKRQTNRLETDLAPLLSTAVKRPVTWILATSSKPRLFLPLQKISITESTWAAGSSVR